MLTICDFSRNQNTELLTKLGFFRLIVTLCVFMNSLRLAKTTTARHKNMISETKVVFFFSSAFSFKLH